ncbi:MAG: discoidin domain-containing protein [Acidimicrobiales bacterium]
MRALRQRLTAGRAARRGTDEGSALVIALVMIILCALVVLPVLQYAQTVSRQNRVLQTKSARLEAVKGGLRTALADPLELYKTCDDAGLTVPVSLAGPSLSTAVSTQCWKMSSALAEDPNTIRYGTATTQVGATVPSGVVGTVMPNSGQSPANKWLDVVSTGPTDDKVWLPELPTRHVNVRSPAGYSMPAGYPACTVYFPGTYIDPVTITGTTPVYFTSGVYYFENTVRFSGDANVVVGGGAVEGCTTDQEAAFYATGAPAVHNITGIGATWVFGAAGRLVVDDTTAGSSMSIRFNKRYVGAADVSTAPTGGVSIESVNGELTGAGYVPLDRSGSLYVPISNVAGSPPSPATSSGFKPSTLVPNAPTSVPGRYVRVQLASSTDALSLAEVKVSGVAQNGTPGELATNKAATQSSTEGTGAASLAVDGNTNGAFASGSVSSTTEADEPNPWWQVDLGNANLSVSSVTLFNRTDACCQSRLANYTVFVSTTDMTGRSYADLLADPTIQKVTNAAAAGASVTIPFNGGAAAVPAPIVEVNLTTARPVVLDIPGYTAVPQGRVVINTAAGAEVGKDISIGGGILAATIEISPARPATFAFGLVNPVVLQTLKIVTTTTSGFPVVTSTAIVQVKENGAYAVNSWSTS